MATTLYLVDGTPRFNHGLALSTLAGGTAYYLGRLLSTSRGSAAQSATRATVAGATNGLEIPTSADWISAPLSADVTISGTITFNMRMLESSMLANAGAQVVVERIDHLGAVVSTVINSERGVEMGTSEAAQNWTGAPTSTAFNKGDRIRVRVAFNDAGGTMASGHTVTFYWNGPTSGASGDSFITFNENLSFTTLGVPTGSKFFFRDTAGPAVGADLEKLLDAARGSSTSTRTTTVPNGPTAPIRITDTTGGTALEWYTPPLSAFTLAGKVYTVFWAMGNSGQMAMRVQIAVTNEDGSSPTVWGECEDDNLLISSGASAAKGNWVTADDLAVTDGQRIRVRVYIDEYLSNLSSGQSPATFYYDGPTGSAEGDSYIILDQTVTEYAPGTAIPPNLLTDRHTPRRRLHQRT